MLRHARIVDAVVIEIIEVPEGFGIGDVLHPSLADQCHQCSAVVAAGWSFDGETFLPPIVPAPDLAQIVIARIRALTADCAAAITGGYVSDALGNPHAYPSGITDQINMMGSVTASLLPGTQADWATPFWCRDADGVWAFRMHSAAQIQQAGADGKTHVVTCQAQLETLNAQVMAAATVSEVEAIGWPNQ